MATRESIDQEPFVTISDAETASSQPDSIVDGGNETVQPTNELAADTGNVAVSAAEAAIESSDVETLFKTLENLTNGGTQQVSPAFDGIGPQCEQLVHDNTIRKIKILVFSGVLPEEGGRTVLATIDQIGFPRLGPAVGATPSYEYVLYLDPKSNEYTMECFIIRGDEPNAASLYVTKIRKQALAIAQVARDNQRKDKEIKTEPDKALLEKLVKLLKLNINTSQ